MKKILILGSTGSIGRNSLELVRNNRTKYEIVGLSGNSNITLLEKQIEEFYPKYVCVGNEKDRENLENKYKGIKFFVGDKGLAEISKIAEYDIILTAVSGSIGIDATVEAIKREKRVALANKETMVSAGFYINRLLKQYKNAEIIPVDSEHSAIFQSMQGFRKEDIKKLILTASGGSFRGSSLDDLKNVTVEQALKHPNWSMGRKITIDSSTLVNKGLEIIEAHELFGLSYDRIDVIVHPQSIIHSMVEYIDGSIISQMGVPDMKTPILYALSYPKKDFNSAIETMDFKKYSNLSFEEVDRKVFRSIDLAYRAGRGGHTLTTVFNAANEVAVDLFLKGKIKFLEIYSIIEESMDEHSIINLDRDDALDIIKNVDREIRIKVREKWER
ncbi:MAG: 1-deoxy-D-xylulose-5-phosphate reductoisomerase [Fusobacterium sp.]|uniref:1-deoxy-D-xylulose-5-phosphate reductoisomerase n=1 Tax=Fusobacterium sp. TaxID=68766 RepID=UPI0026DBBA23|nr:1-deoxy-D-xylulose-5-phosphate reductoisomerase [Fusobacterium sp.]MDO4690545.1 1-deoxy-D-xylulose-5-phosphate reductoisomerase [Fusobacterium sp.]